MLIFFPSLLEQKFLIHLMEELKKPKINRNWLFKTFWDWKPSKINKEHRYWQKKKLTLKPVGHQSTNWMDLLVLMTLMAALTSLGTTSPRYNMQLKILKFNIFGKVWNVYFIQIFFFKILPRHVFSVTGIAFHHLVGGFEASVGDLRHR